MSNQKLIITQGLPGSGKTTRAKAWVADGARSRTRLNRDDLRQMMFGGWTGIPEQENAVTVAQHASLRALLRCDYDVVCDDTNLRPEYREALERIAAELHAAVEVWDLTDVPVEVCIERDAAPERVASGRQVGEHVIRDMHEQWLGTSSPDGGDRQHEPLCTDQPGHPHDNECECWCHGGDRDAG